VTLQVCCRADTEKVTAVCLSYLVDQEMMRLIDNLSFQPLEQTTFEQ